MAKEPDRLGSFDAWKARADRVAFEAWEAAHGSLPLDEHDRSRTHRSPLTEDFGDMDCEQVRLATLEALLDFIWAEGPCLLQAATRLYHITYNVSPALLWLMNQTELGRQLNQCKGTFQAADKRVWEAFLESRGFLGTRAHGKKSNEARRRYSADKQGNNCRRGGKRAARKESRINGATKPAKAGTTKRKTTTL